MRILSLSNPPEPIALKLPSQQGTMPSTKTLLSVVITQPPSFIPPTSQVSKSRPAPQPFFQQSSVYSTFGSNKTVGSTDFGYRLEKFLNGIKARTVHQLGHNLPQIQNSSAFGTIIE